MNDERDEWISPELAHELSETAATLTRLGVTLAGVPVAMLPREQRERMRQVTDEVFRFGSLIPRTVTTLLQELAEEPPRKPQREDLGSRLRRAQDAQGVAVAQQEEPTVSDPSAADDPLPGEQETAETVEEALQDAWNDPPLEPSEQPEQDEA